VEKAAVRAQVEKAAVRAQVEKAADSNSTKVASEPTGSEGFAVHLPRDFVHGLEQLESFVCSQLFLLVPEVFPETTSSCSAASSLDSNCYAGLFVAE